MASKAKNHVAEPTQQSKPVPPVERAAAATPPKMDHIGSIKEFKEARREWRGLCDQRLAMVKEVLDGPAHAEFVRIVERMDELAKQIVQSAYGGDLDFDGKLDVAVFKGRFIYEHYHRLRTIPASGAWYLAFELCCVDDCRKRGR